MIKPSKYLFFLLISFGCTHSNKFRILEKWEADAGLIQYVVWTNSTDSLELMKFVHNLEEKENANKSTTAILFCKDSLNRPSLKNNGAILNSERGFAIYNGEGKGVFIEK